MIWIVILGVREVNSWSNEQADLIGRSGLLAGITGLFLILILMLYYFDVRGIFTPIIYYISFIQYTRIIFYFEADDSLIVFLDWLTRMFKPYGAFSIRSYNFIENFFEEVILGVMLSFVLMIRARFKKSSRKILHCIALVIFVTAQDFSFYAFYNIRVVGFTTVDIFTAMGISAIYMSAFYNLLVVTYLICALAFFSREYSFFYIFKEELDKKPRLYLVILYSEFFISGCFAAYLAGGKSAGYFLLVSLDFFISNLYTVIYLLVKKPYPLGKNIIACTYHSLRVLLGLLSVLIYYNQISPDIIHWTVLTIFALGLICCVSRCFFRENNRRIEIGPAELYSIDKTLDMIRSEEALQEGLPESSIQAEIQTVKLKDIEINESKPEHLIETSEVQTSYYSHTHLKRIIPNLNKFTVKRYVGK